MAPNHPIVYSLPTPCQGWLCWPKENDRSDSMWLPRLGHKRYCSFCLGVFLRSLSGDGQLPCYEETQAALWRGPRDKELMSPANSQQGTEAWRVVWVNHLGIRSSRLEMTTALANPWLLPQERLQAQKHLAKLPPKSWAWELQGDKCILL